MDHGITVLTIHSAHKIFVSLVIVSLKKSRYAIEIDGAKIYHSIRIFQLGSLKVASDCKPSILFNSVTTKIAVSYFILRSWIAHIARLTKIGKRLLGTFLYSETIFVHKAKIKQSLRFL